MSSYIQLSIAALLPVIAAVLTAVADKKTAFGRLNNTVKQIVIGVLFGGLAVLGTEWGIPIDGAQINCRDAAVIISGLMFGAPSGLIAGVIGGVERWFAVYWGVGSFTRIACTVSTVFAGIYAALLRKFLFDNRRPAWLISFTIGTVIEVFHLTMVFITNIATPERAMEVVRVCSVPMITANAVSVMLAAVFMSFLYKEKILARHDSVRISQIVQRWLLVVVILAFAGTSYFVYILQTRLADSQTETVLSVGLENISRDIHDTSDKNLLSLTFDINREVSAGGITDTDALSAIAKRFDVAEISLINKQGIIEFSSCPEYINFDMASGEQSSEFLTLLYTPGTFVQKYGPISSDSTTVRKYAALSTEYGFIQVGYDAEQFHKDISSVVSNMAQNRTVGRTGYIVILDSAYHTVSAPAALKNTRDLFTADAIPGENITFTLQIGSEECYCRSITSEGYHIVTVLPKAEAMQTRNIAAYVNTFMEILVFAVLFALIYLLIKHVIVNQLTKINGSLAKITEGDLEVTVDVRSNAEFASLSDDINKTVDTLKRYIAEASARIDEELELAKNIQSSALPGLFPAFPKRKEFDIYASMDPAKEVGGDFYDFYMTGTDTLHFLIADVSGKGIPAAMFMMRAKAELKALTETELPVNEVFADGNTILCEGNDAEMFVTAWQGGIDLREGVLRYANAGHNPPLIRRAGGRFEFAAQPSGLVLGIMPGVKYKLRELSLNSGDTLFLYTDGVTEATDADEQLYGNDRLLNALNNAGDCSVKELCEAVKADVEKFVGKAPQFDDITMLAFRLT